MSSAHTDKEGNLYVKGSIKQVGHTDVVIAAVAGTTPAGGTGATAGAYDTAAHRDELIATVAEQKARFNELLVELKAKKVIATV